MNRNQIINDASLIQEALYSPKNKYGLCNDCKFLKFRTTYYGKESAWCSENDFVSLAPSPVDPIRTCTNFYPKGQPSIWEMIPMAWVVERRIRIKPGFRSEKEIEVSITKQEEKNEDV